MLRVQVAIAVRARHHPQAAVFDGGIVHGDPGAAERAVARRDIDFVLVPGLPLKRGRLNEQHRLHAFDAAIPVGHVGRNDLAEDAANLGVLDIFERDRADVMWLMDAENSPQHFVVAHRRGQSAQRFAGVAAAREINRVVAQLLDFFGRNGGRARPGSPPRRRSALARRSAFSARQFSLRPRVRSIANCSIALFTCWVFGTIYFTHCIASAFCVRRAFLVRRGRCSERGVVCRSCQGKRRSSALPRRRGQAETHDIGAARDGAVVGAGVVQGAATVECGPAGRQRAGHGGAEIDTGVLCQFEAVDARVVANWLVRQDFEAVAAGNELHAAVLGRGFLRAASRR